MWYYGKYKCDHEGRVNIIGPEKNRGYKIDAEFSKLCPECRKAQREKEIERYNEEAIKKNAMWELPSLEGSEKQILWANRIRVLELERFTKLMEDNKPINLLLIFFRKIREEFQTSDLNEFMKSYRDRPMELLTSIEDYLIYQTKASWWIENRDGGWTSDILLQVKSWKRKAELPKDDIDIESSLAPIEVKYPGIVKIYKVMDALEVEYEKNEIFISIMRDFFLRWNGKRWSKKITEKTGSFKDRAAEIAHTLLKTGFSVSITDDKVIEMSISGEFLLECYRWVDISNKGKLVISWKCKEEDEDKKLKDFVMKIIGAKRMYGKVYVDASHFEEVRDFAEECGFRFTKKASTFIEEYENKIKNIRQVMIADTQNQANQKDRESEDRLKKILHSSGAILEDLMDD